MEDLSKLHSDIDRFYSKGYLACWCSIVRTDWSRFLAGVFGVSGSDESGIVVSSKDCKLLDVGCGPSIANIISASKSFSHITMADYLTSNRDEVARFKSDAED